MLLNVDGFSNLNSVGWNMSISSNVSLTNVDGFSNLNSVGFHMIIQHNYLLANVDGFSNLNSIVANLSILHNDLLENVDGFSNLNSISSLRISSNSSLSNVDGFSNLNSITWDLYIGYNDILSNVDAFSNLDSLGGDLSVPGNNLLSSIDGLSNLSFIGGDLTITENPLLSDCCVIQDLLIIPNAIVGDILIENNLSPCDTPAGILEGDCGNNINKVKGNVFLDTDTNCQLDQSDIPFGNMIVQAISDEYTYTTVTDSLGDYEIYVDTGSYDVQVYMGSPYAMACTASYPVDILNDTISSIVDFDFPVMGYIDCPFLEVNVSTFALRECFDNTYYVQYCNSGTADATDAYVEIVLNGPLSIIDASIPFTESNGIYTFDVGNVGIGECGNFNMNIHLPCDAGNAGQFQGQTFCIKAHIYPDTICLPPLDLWDGSSVEVEGECDQDSIRFRVRNIGEGDMLSDKTLQVFEDQVMFQEESFQLLSGEEIAFVYLANGSTFRLEAEQSDGHPGNSNPSIVVEGCGTGNPVVSLGFVNQFAQDDGNVFVDIECREVTGSYDPNDKQGFPTGYGEEHFVEKNTDIEYLVRFQNTGTDTAFTVVITDEISPLLDIATIQPGVSSHPYVFEIENDTISFTFNDILLVDSLTNEAESHGFVKFRISQQPDLPNGTLLENTAKIYFDFNAPIITNTTFHTVGENFVTVELVSDIEDLFEISSIKVYPNPFSEVIHFEIGEGVFEDIILTVYDVGGRVVAAEDYNSSTFEFHRGDLNSGVYFYTISVEGVDVANGKMVLR